MAQSGVAALTAIATPRVPDRDVTPGLGAITSLLYFSAGVTRRRGDILFRAAACTGALYEVELYLACGELPDLAAGLYHFNPGDLSLRRLREGDFRAAIAAASGRESAISHAPAIVIATGVYWRNAWKYQARAYRHLGWDNGTLTANLLAMAAALGLPSKLVCGFVDEEINRLLDVDASREVALSLLAVGRSQTEPPAPPPAPPLRLDAVPYSKPEVDYPAMRAMHEASSLETPEEAIAWRDEPTLPLDPLSDDAMPSDTIEEVVLRRGSSRRFTGAPIQGAELSTILERATRGIPADFPALNDIYLIVNAVDGLEPGAYFFDAGQRTLEVLELGDFRAQAAHLALDQQLAGDASAAIFFLPDLQRC